MKDLTLNCTHCTKCKKDYLVGINGKDIRKERFDGGSIDKIPYICFGFEKMKDSKPLPKKKIPCKNCGTLCKIEEAKTS